MTGAGALKNSFKSGAAITAAMSGTMISTQARTAEMMTAFAMFFSPPLSSSENPSDASYPLMTLKAGANVASVTAKLTATNSPPVMTTGGKVTADSDWWG